MIFICYPKCTTCKKAKDFLDSRGMTYDERNIKENNPSYEELKEWHIRSGLPLKRFFNTSGTIYKSMQLSSKLSDMSDEEQLKLLAADGMLVKRPILVSENSVLVGFKEQEWDKLSQ